MARSKGDLMRAHGKKRPARKSFPNLGGANLTREELDVEIHLQLIRINKLMLSTGKQVRTWLKDIERHMRNDEDTL